MNIYLKHAKVVAKGVEPTEANEYMVRGSTLRYVILPEAMDTHDVLKRAAVASSSHNRHTGRRTAADIKKK